MEISGSVWIIILVLLAIVCAALSSSVAKKKGHSGDTWGTIGFFFGVLGLIAAAGLPDKRAMQVGGDAKLKTCPDCAESIKRAAKVCRFCGYQFGGREVEEVLIESLESGSISEKIEALETIGEIGDKSLIPHVMKAFWFSQHELDLETKCVVVMERFLDRSMVADLIKIVEESQQESKVLSAVRLLGQLKDESSIPALVSVLEYDFLEGELTTALLAFGQSAVPHLERVLKHGNRRQRKAVKRVLSKMAIL